MLLSRVVVFDGACCIVMTVDFEGKSFDRDVIAQFKRRTPPARGKESKPLRRQRAPVDITGCGTLPAFAYLRRLLSREEFVSEAVCHHQPYE